MPQLKYIGKPNEAPSLKARIWWSTSLKGAFTQGSLSSVVKASQPFFADDTSLALVESVQRLYIKVIRDP